MTTARKILVSGDVCGKFNTLFERVRNILKKNKDFEMLLCVGSFFGSSEESKKEWEGYLAGNNSVPISTFLLGPTEMHEVSYYSSVSLENGGELCENVTYLGRKGILKTKSGLQIAYLSGLEKSEAPEEGCHFVADDVTSLESLCQDESFKGLDILISSSWPKGVSNFANQPERVDPEKNGSALVSRLAQQLRPRYHFTSHEGVYYERPPYRDTLYFLRLGVMLSGFKSPSHSRFALVRRRVLFLKKEGVAVVDLGERNHLVLRESAQHVTRFIALAQAGNPHKKKYMYAFNIVPLVSMDKNELVKQPPDVTECPYNRLSGSNVNTADQSTNLQSQASATGQNFFFDMSNTGKSQGPGQKRRRDHGGEEGGSNKQPRQRKGPPPLKGSCWFCLGSPEVEKHLIVSVGDASYVALAKGGLVADHVLICPIVHFESTVKLTEDVLMEIEKYKRALRKMYHKEGKSCVIFERNYYTQHLQLQVIPVPPTDVEELKDIFREHGDSNSLAMRDVPANTELSQIVPVGAPYFVVEFDNEEKLLHRVSLKMPLQFGREVAASPALLNMPDRVDWKACKVSKDEETRMAAVFRKRFQPYDFNLE